MSGPAAQVSKTIPGNDEGLAAFRENAAAVRGFSDATEPNAPAAIETKSAPPAPPAQDDEPAMPRLRIDPRNAISARVKASRAAANPDGETAPAAKFNIPEGVRVDGDPDEAARLAEESQAEPESSAPAAAPPQAPARQSTQSPRTQDGSYSLRVNNNTFTVSRDELLRYAEVDPDEASDYSDIALVKLAQKQLAASDTLERAKAEAKSIRQAQRTQPGHTPDQDEPPANNRDAAATQGLHSLSDRELIEKVQFGEPDEALEAQQLLTRRQFERLSVNDRLSSIDREIGEAIEGFGAENADIAADSFMQSVHQTALVNETVDEIAAHAQGMTAHHVAQLKANPQLAMQAYKAARLDGLNLRTPVELFNAAANTVRTRFGNPPPAADRGAQRDAPSPAAAQDRTLAKRGLIAQPRPESASIAGQQQQSARRPSASDTIRGAYGNRMNRG